MNFRLENTLIDLAREAPFSLGPLEIRPASREVIAGETREILEPRIMQVLVALAKRRGEVVSRDELTVSCWNGRVVGDDAINRCTAGVRKLAATYGGFALETIPRIGYRLTETAQAEPSQLSPSKNPQAPAFSVARILAHWRLAALAVLALAIVAFVVWMPRPAAPVRPVKSRLTIAVLPFTPLYVGPNAQQLGDAIASSMADALASFAFDVISPTKSLSFRGAAKAGAAQALHADFLIDGDLRQESGKIIATLRIIEGSTGLVAGAGSIERPVAEAMNLPTDVARQMAVLGTASRGYSHASGWDARVMAAYFRALYQSIGQGDAYGAYETARAVAKATPNDASAQTLYGFMAAYLVNALPPEKRPAMVAQARQAAKRAIALDTGSGEPYAVLALSTPLFDWTLREQHLRRGLAISAEAQNTTIQLIELLQNAGRFIDSVPFSETLFRNNAYQPRKLIELGNAKLWTNQIETAQTLIARGLKLHPDTSWFAAKMFELTAFQGKFDEADALLQSPPVKALFEADGSLKVFHDIAAALRHRRQSETAAVVQDCAQPQGRTAEIKRTCFMALIALGRLDEAFRLAAIFYPDQRGATPEARERRWLASEMPPTAYLSIPVTAPLRRDPRYRDLVERVGLLQYWRASGHPPDFCAVEKAPVCALLRF